MIRITLLRERFFFLLIAWISISSLCACAPTSSWPDFGPAGSALRYVLTPQATPKLPPGFDYLQVDTGGQQTLLVLARAAPGSPDIYGYSAQSEMLHLRAGRIWRVLGMTTEWREQRGNPPAWEHLPTNGEAVSWTRQINRMPGYRWNETDQIQTRRLSKAPSPALAQSWPNAQWFEDAVESQDANSQPWHFAQHFGLFEGHVVYSEQCIARDLCLKMTRMKNTP